MALRKGTVLKRIEWFSEIYSPFSEIPFSNGIFFGLRTERKTVNF